MTNVAYTSIIVPSNIITQSLFHTLVNPIHDVSVEEVFTFH